MGLIFRKSIKFGPFVFNLSRRGASTSLKAGPVTYGGRRRRTTVNLPGPFSWTMRGRKR